MQNINLLSALPPRPKQYLSAEWLLFIIAVFTTFLMLIYGLSHIPLIKQHTLLSKLTLEKNSLNEQITALNQQKSTIQATYDKQKSTEFSLPQLSPYLEKLSKATPEGAWLISMQFSNLDNSLSLNGYAVNYNLIMNDFLENLANLQYFSKGKLTTLNFTKMETGEYAGSIYFQLTRTATTNKDSVSTGSKP